MQNSLTDSSTRRLLLLASTLILIGLVLAAGVLAVKMRPVDAPIISAIEQNGRGSSEVVLAIAIPDRCEKGKLHVRYVEGPHAIHVKARYARKSILPPSDFSCEAILRLNGLVVKVALDLESSDRIDTNRSNRKSKFIFDKSQSVPRQVVFVKEFSPEPQQQFGPGLEVKVERVRSLD